MDIATRPPFLGVRSKLTWAKLTALPEVKLALNPRLQVFADAGSTPATDTDPIQEWHDQSGNNNDVTQTTVAKQPLFVASYANFGGNPAVQLDGTDDILVASSVFLTGNVGAVFALVRLDAEPDTRQVVLSVAEDSVSVRYTLVTARFNDTNPNIAAQFDNASPDVNVVGSTTISQDTNYIMMVASTGSEYTLRVSKSLESKTVVDGTDDGSWFADVSSPDQLAVGAAKRLSEALHMSGHLGPVIVIDGEYPSSSLIKDIERLLDRYASGVTIG